MNYHEAVFAAELEQEGLGGFVQEYQFVKERKWRFDFAWPEKNIALEIEGGIWQQTSGGFSKGHAHPRRFLQDIEKYNEATLNGWVLLRASPAHVESGYARQLVKRALGIAEDGPIIPALSPNMTAPSPKKINDDDPDAQIEKWRAEGRIIE